MCPREAKFYNPSHPPQPFTEMPFHYHTRAPRARTWRDSCIEFLAYLSIAGTVLVFILLMTVVPEIPITILLLSFLALCVACLRIYQLAEAPPSTPPVLFSSTV